MTKINLFKLKFFQTKKINYLLLNIFLTELKKTFNFLNKKDIHLNIKKYDYLYLQNIFLNEFNLFSFKKNFINENKKEALLFFVYKKNFINYKEYNYSCLNAKSFKYLKTLNIKFNYLYKHQDLYWYLLQSIFQIFKLKKFSKFLELQRTKENFYIIFNYYLENEQFFDQKFNNIKKIYINVYPLDDEDSFYTLKLQEIFLFYFLLNFDSPLNNLNYIDKKNPLLFFTVYDYYLKYVKLIKIKNNFYNTYLISEYLNFENEKRIFNNDYKKTISFFFQNVFRPLKSHYIKELKLMQLDLFKKFHKLKYFNYLKKKFNINNSEKLANNINYKDIKFIKKITKKNKLKYYIKKILILNKKINYLNKINLNLKDKKLKKIILKDLFLFDKDTYFKFINFYYTSKNKKKNNYLKFLFYNFMDSINKNKFSFNSFTKFDSNYFLNFSFYNATKGIGNNSEHKPIIHKTSIFSIIKNLNCIYALNPAKQITTKNLNYKLIFYVNSLKKKLYNDFFLNNSYKTIYKKIKIINSFKEEYAKEMEDKYGDIDSEIKEINGDNLLISNKAVNLLMKNGKKELIRKKINTVYFLLKTVYGLAKPRYALEVAITKHKPIVKLKKHRKSGKDYLVPYPIYSKKHQIYMSYKLFFESLKEYNIKNFAKKFPQYFALEIFLSLFDHPKSRFLKKIKEYNSSISEKRGYIRFLKSFK